MKRFLPSNVMLIPFVVKHYPTQDDEQESEQLNESERPAELEQEE